MPASTAAGSAKPRSFRRRLSGVAEWGGWSLVRELPRLDPRFSLALLLVSIAGVAAPLGSTLVTGQLVGSLPGAVRTGISSAAGTRLLTWLAIMSALFIVEQLVGPLTTLVRARLMHNVNTRLRQELLEATTSPPGLALIEDAAFQDQVALAKGVGAAERTPGQAAGALATIGTRFATVLGATAIVSTFSWWLAILLLGAQLALYIRLRISVRRVVSVYVDQSQDMRRAHYLRELTTTPPAAKELRVFGLPGWVMRRQREAWLTAMRVAWRARSDGIGVIVLLTVLAAAACGFALVLLGRGAIAGAIPTGALVVYASAVLQVPNLVQINDDDQAVDLGLAALPALRRVQAMAAAATPEERGRVDLAGLPAREIRFEKVSFRYPGSDHNVYDGLDLVIRAGESLAIVGPNGAGKTTLVKLIARLYEPTSGRITVDGVDIRELDAMSWQARVAAIFQDFVRLPLSARDNVEAGAVEGAGEQGALTGAAAKAGVDELLAELPLGWDTVLSREYSDGTDLSGGQWQRVALARALYGLDTGAGILVLDEPTANLDVRAEATIFNRLLETTRGRTTLLISHRFSTVRRAQRICVLDEGRIVEEGRHDELVRRGGRYAAMFALQASQFQSGAVPGQPSGPDAQPAGDEVPDDAGELVDA